MLRRMAVLATLAIILSGCSVAVLRGPPRLRPGAPLPARAECTTNMVLPGLELSVASLSTALLIDFLAPRDEPGGSERDLVIPFFSIPVVSGVSGLIGVTRVQACRDFAEMIALTADTTAREPARFIDPGRVTDRSLLPWALPDGRAAVGGWSRDSTGLAPAAQDRCRNSFRFLPAASIMLTSCSLAIP